MFLPGAAFPWLLLWCWRLSAEGNVCSCSWHGFAGCRPSRHARPVEKADGAECGGAETGIAKYQL